MVSDNEQMLQTIKAVRAMGARRFEVSAGGYIVEFFEPPAPPPAPEAKPLTVDEQKHHDLELDLGSAGEGA